MTECYEFPGELDAGNGSRGARGPADPAERGAHERVSEHCEHAQRKRIKEMRNSMPRGRLPAGCSILLFAAPLWSQQAGAWKDPSPHTAQMVAVAENVRLEVLDWGGSGRPIVLLAGGGDTAHVFDEFAPKLTPAYHVLGITRRGFGASSFTAAEYGADRLGDDVVAGIDSLKLDRPVLVGHSIAGEELSSVATRHPERTAGLVYLDAGYPYAFDDGTGPAFREFQEIRGPQPPPPGEADLASFSALQKWYVRVNGFRFPEAEFRQMREATPNGRVGKQRNFPGSATLLMGMKKYAHIPVPALAIFAIPHDQGTWVNNSTDPAVREAARTYTAAEVALTESQATAFENGAPTARVIRLPRAHHYVFLSNEADVLRNMRAFLFGLQ